MTALLAPPEPARRAAAPARRPLDEAEAAVLAHLHAHGPTPGDALALAVFGGPAPDVVALASVIWRLGDPRRFREELAYWARERDGEGRYTGRLFVCLDAAGEAPAAALAAGLDPAPSLPFVHPA